MIVEFKAPPSDIYNSSRIRELILEQSSQKLPKDFYFKITRRNIDARSKNVWYILRAEISDKEILSDAIQFDFKYVSNQNEVHIIGAGPCGYFAALHCLRKGLKPIILDRGKDVKDRRRDLRAIQQDGIVNPHSNYCFGEGGAGTYSDGKLYTRSDKRGNIRDVLNLLVYHGASQDILVDVHPHIGSNKLPQIIERIRNTILQYGGEVHFNQYVEDIEFSHDSILSLTINGIQIKTNKVILATGHSARDIFELLNRKNIEIECKDFALGVRIEHPQSLIDQIQYRQNPRHENLPAASYSLACQIGDQGVFSFCMCPGGLIVPAATSPGEIVVNGMSLSRRDSPYANSGFVTSVNEIDFEPYKKYGALKGMYYQKTIEQKVFTAGNGSQAAPGQRVMDFIQNKSSNSLPSSSYIPGIISSEIANILPKNITQRLKEGLQQFGNKMSQYLTNEAVLVATESRTSSPVRIPRDKETCQHIRIKNLYPAGEGAGYAGGILSAALDGIRIAEAIGKS